MAPKGGGKTISGSGSGGGRIKFRFVDIEMENVNESITEGLKSLAAALSRGGPQHTSVRMLPRTPQSLSQPGASVVDPPDDLEEQLGEPEEVQEELEEIDERTVNAAPISPKPRKFKAPKFLREMNLTTASVSVENYLAQKNPSNTQDKYLVIAQWFKEFMSIEDVNMDHIFTVYDLLSWRAQMPQDANAPFRWLKHANLMDSGAARGTYKINWNGTKSVAAMGANE